MHGVRRTATVTATHAATTRGHGYGLRHFTRHMQARFFFTRVYNIMSARFQVFYILFLPCHSYIHTHMYIYL